MLIAFQHDRGVFFPSLGVFFRNLGPLLPCKFCRESYPTLLMVDDLEPAIREKRMVTFVYDLHNKVNRKLALQRLENLKPFCNIMNPEAMLEVIDNHPSIQIVMKRNELFKEDPLNFEALLLIVIALLKRSKDTKPNYMLFIATLQISLQNVGTTKYDVLARLLPLEIIRYSSDDGLNRLYEIFSDFFHCTSKHIDQKLELMVSGACVKGTCI